MRHPRRYLSNVLLTGALVVGTGAAVLADDRAGAHPAAADHGSDMVASDREDDRIERFVDAADEMHAIRARYAARIRDAEPGERAALKARAREEMMAAVEGRGLSLAAYREFGHLLEDDSGPGALVERFDDARRSA